MGPFAARSLDAQGVALIALGEVRNDFWHGGGKQKGAPFSGRCFQNEFQVFAETEIEHFIGFIENHRLEIGDVQHAALEMITQAPRGSYNDVGAIGEAPALALWVHAADAGEDTRAGIMVEPFQLALHLHGQFTSRGHDEGHGRGFLREAFGLAQKGCGDGQAIGHGFAGPGLGRNHEIAAFSLGFEDSKLNRGRVFVFALGEGAREWGRGLGKGQFRGYFSNGVEGMQTGRRVRGCRVLGAS